MRKCVLTLTLGGEETISYFAKLSNKDYARLDQKISLANESSEATGLVFKLQPFQNQKGLGLKECLSLVRRSSKAGIKVGSVLGSRTIFDLLGCEAVDDLPPHARGEC